MFTITICNIYGDVDEVDLEEANEEDGELYPLPVMEVEEADEGRLALVVPPVGDVTLKQKCGFLG